MRRRCLASAFKNAVVPQGFIVGVWLVLAIVAANLPLLSERWFFVFTPSSQLKPFWLRLLEWAILYGLLVGTGFGLEYKITGVHSVQDWEFYVVTLCLFAVAALPGFVYRYQLRRLLESISRGNL